MMTWLNMMARLSLLLLASSLLCVPVDPIAVPSYMVIGQQKSGTSTLWALATQHPQLAEGTSANRAKELNFFQFQVGFHPNDPTIWQRNSLQQYGVLNERCDRSAFQYISMWQNQRPGMLAGDFSAIHLSCHCCPAMFQRINPDTKILMLLRDPVERGLSRFMEQYNWPFRFFGFIEKHVSNFTSFEQYAEYEMQRINKCLEDGPLMDTLAPEGSELQSLKELIQHRCLTSSNVVGWSVYSVFLKHWLKYFSKDQMMVLFTSELDRDPLSVMRKMESFLGLQPHDWDETKLRTKFNTKKQYGWAAAVKPEGAGKDETDDLLRKKAGQTLVGQKLHQKSAEEMKGDTSRLTQFFKPYMAELKKMADDGIISSIPEDFMAPYL